MACLPKSGSTYLTNLLADLFGLNHAYAFYEAHQNEQEIHLPSLAHCLARPSVIQQHCRATEPNLQVLQALQIRPIFLVRNLLDALASMRDMLVYADEPIFFPTAYTQLPEPDRTMAIGLKFGFWYVECFASWYRAVRDGRIAAMILPYERLKADKMAAVAAAATHVGLQTTPERIRRTIDALDAQPKRTRRSAGGTRGEAAPEALRVYLAGHTRCFPDVDFSMLGLG